MDRVEEFINRVYKDKRAKRKVFENILKYAKNSVNENIIENEKIIVKNKDDFYPKIDKNRFMRGKGFEPSQALRQRILSPPPLA